MATSWGVGFTPHPQTRKKNASSCSARSVADWAANKSEKVNSVYLLHRRALHCSHHRTLEQASDRVRAAVSENCDVLLLIVYRGSVWGLFVRSFESFVDDVRTLRSIRRNPLQAVQLVGPAGPNFWPVAPRPCPPSCCCWAKTDTSVDHCRSQLVFEISVVLFLRETKFYSLRQCFSQHVIAMTQILCVKQWFSTGFWARGPSFSKNYPLDHLGHVMSK